jgi:hypothetical protein
VQARATPEAKFTLKTKSSFLALLMTLLFALSQPFDAQSAAFADSPANRAPLQISLNIPEDDAGNDISNPDFHFAVVISNISS